MKLKKQWVPLFVGILILGLILGMAPTSASAASSSEIQEQIEELEKKNEELENQINNLEGQQSANVTEIRAMLEQKNILDQQISLMFLQINNLNAQVAAYNVLVADKQEELDDAQLRLEELTQLNRERIRAMEENGQLTYWSVLAEANSFFELLDRLYIIEEIAEADSRRIKEMKQAAEDVETVRSAMLTELDNLKAANAEASALQAELEDKSIQSQNLLTELLARGEEYKTLLDQLEQEQDAYLEEIAKKEDEYDDAKYSEYMATATKPTQPTGGGNGGSEAVDPSGMTWLVPCDYTLVTSPFGMRNDPFTGEPKMHKGVDLWCPNMYGNPIYATRGGYVTLAGWYGSGGNTVMVQHEAGYKSIYMHMCYFIVSEGDYVSAGQIIGYVGDTGGVTGTHLHFEIRKDGNPVNPMEYIG